ncbi:MAG: DUF302 domain-containing protein [Rhodobacteraceae bacterium]|jgi:uncharacterized protein (DUF302 family)|nr:DUF302 domain-containing protein [Paracoccaceae bacterium]
MKTLLLATLASAALAIPAHADELVLTPTGMSFEDAAFAVESAIVGRGLVIDYTSHVGEMLERTRADMGSDVVLFDNANIYLFCSAALSRQVMEADWQNIANCPYGIQVIERPGEEVVIGYVRRAAETMAPVNDLLAEIVEEATF